MVFAQATSSLQTGVALEFGLEVGVLALVGAGATLANNYSTNQSQTNLAAAQVGMEQAASAGLQTISSEVNSAAQSATQLTIDAATTSDAASVAQTLAAPVDISAVMGSEAVQTLQAVLNGSTFLAGLDDILQSLNGVPVDGGPTESLAGVDYTNLQSVEEALSPLLGPRFSGLVNLQTFANFELNQINFQTYLLGDIGFFDTSDATGLQNFLTYVANAFAAGQPITDASAVPVPSDIDPSLLPAFIDRFNLTLQYWSEGIFNTTDVPAGQSQDFIALDTLSDLYSRVAGPIDQTDAALNQTVANDQAMVTSVLQAATQLELSQEQTVTGTCATVKVEIDQSAVMSRSSFVGTLVIDPNIEMDGLSVNLVITDQNGNVVDPSTFGITTTSLTGISALDGTQSVDPGNEVTAQYTFVPSLSAAPTGPTEYNIGGTISSSGPSGNYTADLTPVTVTVLPQPQLVLDYFLQENVVGYDPNMPNIMTPSQPFVLGLQVHNVGAGDADNLTIVSAQPQIVDNEKGLDIAFSILGSQINGAPGTDSLTVNLGNVAAGTTDTAAWFLESSLQGKFLDYQASFTNVNPLNLTEQSIIQTVNIHELIHAGDVNDDGTEDFLTSDNPASLNAPDTLWLSDGTTDPVTDIASTAQETGDENNTITVELLTPTKAAEWDYFDALVPADDSYSIVSVTRADGTELLPGQYWFTDRTFTNQSAEPVYENSIHILDDLISTSYTVTFVKNPTPGVDSITIGLANDTGASPVDKITSNDTLTGSGAPNAIVQFSIDGTLVADTAAADPTGAWSFSPMGLADGTHTVVASETDSSGNTGSASLTFTLDTVPPAVTETLQVITGGSTGTLVSSNDALMGTGDPNATVQFVIDGTLVARTATADASGDWNFTPVGLAPGMHTIVASESDLAGNTGLASLIFTLVHSPLAEAAVISATPVVLADARVSTTDVTTLSIANAATSPAEGLDVAIGSVTGDVIANGTISLLPVGATDSSSISVGLNTSSAGAKSGTVTLSLASDGQGTDGGGITMLQSQTVAVSGSVFRLADAAVGTPPAKPIVHVGDTGALDLAITNAAANDGFSENLRVAIAQTTGGMTAQGPIGEISPGGSGTLTYSFPTAEAGVQSGTITLDFASDGSGIDGYAATPSGTDTVALSATVDNYATAELEQISGGSSIDVSDGTIDLGAFDMGASPIAINLAVLNDAAGPADLLTGTFDISGDPVFSNSGFDPILAGLAAGQADTAPTVSLATSEAGMFSETITLDATGSNASGYSGALTPQTLTIIGTIMPAVVESIGTPGTPGAPDEAGSPGQSETAASDNPSLPDNNADAAGGAGGAGGNGGSSATGPGGNAGAGAPGGGATASASGSPISNATAAGGTGGVGGAPGQGTTTGHSASGGAGGAATASATAVNSAGSASASASATGGAGGASSGTGVGGGAGGVASGTTATASGTTAASATVVQTGGAGGAGTQGAAGYSGAASTLSNAVSGETEDGVLTLSQTAVGGAGGASANSFGGGGGVANSSLTFNDSENATQSADIDGSIIAVGGNAGAGTIYHAGGGAADVTASLTGSGDVTATGEATGGVGSTGSGGNAADSVTAVAGDAAVATADATGGVGGSGAGGTNGGLVTADSAAASGQTATAEAVGTGGAGGTGSGAGNSAGAGGVASGVSATATGVASATASATAAGGAGGAGSNGAAGGAGGQSDIVNAVSGTTSGGVLTLIQVAVGGAGGGSDTGAGGAGASALSQVSYSGIGKPAQTIDASVEGTGGNGGSGATVGAGGNSWDAGTINGTGTTSLLVTAQGGSGGAGGGAQAKANASGGVVDATATADGGAGVQSAGVANATAQANGTSGMAVAESDTSLQPGSLIISASGAASAMVGGSTTAFSQSAIATGVPWASGLGGVAVITGAPTPASVNSVLTTEPAIAAALGGGATVIALGEVGGAYSAGGTGSQTSTASTDIVFNQALLAAQPDLLLSLYRPAAGGSGISGIGFSVSADGTNLLTENFASAASATAWFTDHPVDLGTIAGASTIDVQVALSVTSSKPVSFFDTGFVVADRAI